VKCAWRDLGVPGLWYMDEFVCPLLGISDTDVQCSVYLGNLAVCRFHSIHLALRKCFIHLQHNLRKFLAIFILSQKSKPL